MGYLTQEDVRPLLANNQFLYKTRGHRVPFDELMEQLQNRHMKNVLRFIEEFIPLKFQKYPEVLQIRNESYFLSGNVGGYKTTRMYWHLVNVYIAARLSCSSVVYPDGYTEKVESLYKFEDGPDMILKFRDTFNSGTNKTETEVLDDYRTCSWFYLDDLGAENIGGTGYGPAVLYQIINYRYQHELPILISSNYSLEEMSTKLSSAMKDPTVGHRITRRIEEMCSGRAL